MRAVLVTATILSLIGAASAKPAPPETPRLTASPADLAIAVGAAGAMMESDYFREPGPQYSSRGMSMCRLQTEIFSKVRLAQACH